MSSMSEGHLLATVCAECGALTLWHCGRPEGATPPQLCESCWQQQVRLAYWRDLTGLAPSSGSGPGGPERKEKPPLNPMPPPRTATTPPPHYGRMPTDALRDPDDADAPSLRGTGTPGVEASPAALLARLTLWLLLALFSLVGLALLGGALGLLLFGLWRVLGAVAGYLFSGGTS